MAKEVEKQENQQEKPVQEKSKSTGQPKIESVPLENAVEALADYGGFDLLKDTIEGAGSMEKYFPYRIQ